MSIRRVGILLLKELFQGPRNFMFIFAVIVPVTVSLLMALLFGTVLSGKARLGLVDQGASQLAALAQGLDGILVSQFDSAASMQAAVGRGAVDIGLVLPPEFDEQVKTGSQIRLKVVAWGESLLKNRIVLAAALTHMLRQIAGQEPPIEIVTTTLGEAALPWDQRVLPLIVLLSVLLGGSIVPATSLVEEKQKRTLTALGVTPARRSEVYLAKAIMGMFISTLMGMITLLMNQAFGMRPVLLVLVLVCGASLAAGLGVLAGMLLKDVNSLFTLFKASGIFLYAPALIYMFPELPQWLAKIFPTYYAIQPVIEIVQEGAGWAEVAPEVVICLAVTAILTLIVAWLDGRQMLAAT